MKALALTFLLGSVASAVTAQEAVTLTARLSSDHILPAEPVDIEFSVENKSKAPFTVPETFVLEVTPEGGEPRLARWNDVPPVHVIALPEVWTNHTAVPAGGKRIIRWSSWAAAKGMGIRSLPITTPSSYRIRFAFSEQLPALLDEHASSGERGRTLAALADRTRLLVSNPLRLEVETPLGDDAAVWAKIQHASGGTSWPAGIAELRALSRDIWENHRSSRYAPFAIVGLTADASSDRVRQLREELQKLDSRHGFIEWLELLEAKLLVHEAGVRLSAGASLEEVRRYESLAEDRYQKTLKTSRNEDVVMAAQTGLAKLAEERQINTELFESWKDQPRRRKAPVQPLVTCAKSSDRDTHVVFGYDNPNGDSVMIPIGLRNLFEPGEMDRGQPSTFVPGRHDKAFRVKARDGGTLTWQLDGTVLTVPIGKIRRCSDGQP